MAHRLFGEAMSPPLSYKLVTKEWLIKLQRANEKKIYKEKKDLITLRNILFNDFICSTQSYRIEIKYGNAIPFLLYLFERWFHDYIYTNICISLLD